ncbi:dehydrogenase [Parapedobacter pyrenivorans]|uniref:Dehydrogenase n=1 Tax=Parapedobacter pyrenivorans TaxID=1305674 RepID=A0A917M1S8_9SPHI|nr:dehydrogenase [Parapedobacter pyrenivorans]
MDTSHSIAFTELLNASDPNPAFQGYRVVAAYPYGSQTVKTSVERIPAITEQMKNIGVEIVDSIAKLLRKVDVILLETNDGRLHLQQAKEVIQSRLPLFIDKPIAASYADAWAIFEESDRLDVPVFSTSSLRYALNVEQVINGEIGDVLGAETYSPAFIEPSHPDLFWYAIHGVEMLFAVMGRGCESVQRLYLPDAEIVVGRWTGGRLGSFRGLRSGPAVFGGRAFGANGVTELGTSGSYVKLLENVAQFFTTGVSPVDPDETLELVAFMEAAQQSRAKGGDAVSLADIKG